MRLNPELTSRFCDYRAGHFHAGLDIRTKGKSGYRVYAVDDGYVFRTTTSYKGYGKGLYLRLADGRIAVYGHLSAFEKNLDERIRKIQMKDKSYRQDLYFPAGEFPVKKGQVVGYSGSSGSTAPHLHFEIRSAENRPLNPLKFGYSVNDNVSPVFDKLAVRSYDRGYDPGRPCRIDIIDVLKDGDEYFVPDTIVSDGALALAVSGGDRTDNKGFLYGFYGLELLVDDSLVFSSFADSIAYESTSQQGYIRDMSISNRFAGRKTADNDDKIFFRLYVPPNTDQFFWGEDGANAGILGPLSDPGKVRRFEVAAYDEKGNKSILKGVIMTPYLTSPDPDFISYYRFGDSLEIDFMTFDEASGCRLQYRNSIRDSFDDLECSLSSKTWYAGGNIAYLNTIRTIFPQIGLEYRFSFADSGSRKSSWNYFTDSIDRHGLDFQGSPGYLRIEYFPDSVFSSLSIMASCGGRDWNGRMKASGIGAFYYDIIGEGPDGDTRIVVRSGQARLIDSTLALYPVIRGIEKNLYSPDSALIMRFNENSVYYPVYVFSAVHNDSKVLGNDAIIYDISPLDLIADMPIDLTFDLARLGLDGRKIGAYGYASRQEKWGFIGKSNGSTLSAEALGLGRVALIEDNELPTIKSVSPSRSTRDRTPLLSCFLNDDISGVDLERAPNMWIDGIWVPADYDISSGKFYYQVRGKLRYGKHSLEIEVYDGQGNRNYRKHYFTISSK